MRAVDGRGRGGGNAPLAHPAAESGPARVLADRGTEAFSAAAEADGGDLDGCAAHQGSGAAKPDVGAATGARGRGGGHIERYTIAAVPADQHAVHGKDAAALQKRRTGIHGRVGKDPAITERI